MIFPLASLFIYVLNSASNTSYFNSAVEKYHMNWHDDINWNSIFLLDMPFLEIIIRGTFMYLGLFCLLRLILKRLSVGMSDMLVIVLIADAAQNGMANEYHSIPAGLLLVAVIIFWDFALDWLGYRFPAMEHFLHPPPLPLIKEGKLMRAHMHRELVTKDELMSLLREKGIEDISQVKKACLEGNGEISVITYEQRRE